MSDGDLEDLNRMFLAHFELNVIAFSQEKSPTRVASPADGHPAAAGDPAVPAICPFPH